MKRVLLTLTILLFGLFIPIVNAEEKEMVKVYVFVAGGCPYCEQQIEYLKTLPDYNVKFEIIEKELFIDNVNWDEGADFELGKELANVFYDKDFFKAGYNSTPLVIISDIYAQSGLNITLEEVINKAYEEGDRDIVGCYINDLDVCKIRKSGLGPFDKEYVANEIYFTGTFPMVYFLYDIEI